MSKKIRLAGLCVIVLIIIAAFSAMGVVQANHVSDVTKVQTLQSADTKADISWKSVSSADGYFIYQSTGGTNPFEKIAEIKDKNQENYTVENLQQATEYKFYVTAFKSKKNKIIESEEHPNVSVFTLPSQQVIKNAVSPDEGELQFSWEKNDRADGYQIQYVPGDGSSFDSAEQLDVRDCAKTLKKISKLQVKKIYSVRVRSYVYYKDKMVAGKWSASKSARIQEKVKMPDNIDPSKPMIALTFDDGPGGSSSDKILDILEKYNARATFFMVGSMANDHKSNVKRKAKLGMEIGNHTMTHNHYGKNVTPSDIKKCSEAIKNITGQYPSCFRSTGGNTTDTIRKECSAENMALYYWSLDTMDWKYRNADRVYKTVMNNVKDGDIILMHEIYSSTADAVAKMVPKLIEKGYQLVTVTELVQAKTGKNPKPGQQYVTAKEINNKTS